MQIATLTCDACAGGGAAGRGVRYRDRFRLHVDASLIAILPRGDRRVVYNFSSVGAPRALARRAKLMLLLAVLVLSSVLSGVSVAEPAAKKPNVLFM